MKVGDYVKTKGRSWSPLDSWTVKEIKGNRVHLVRYEGCGMSATSRNIDELELIDNYFSKRSQ